MTELVSQVSIDLLKERRCRTWHVYYFRSVPIPYVLVERFIDKYISSPWPEKVPARNIRVKRTGWMEKFAHVPQFDVSHAVIGWLYWGASQNLHMLVTIDTFQRLMATVEQGCPETYPPCPSQHLYPTRPDFYWSYTRSGTCYPCLEPRMCSIGQYNGWTFRHLKTFHIRNQWRIPAANIFIKFVRIFEHTFHVGDKGCIPIRKILVKWTSIVEHTVHVSHLRGVPFR